ncbi:MAG: TetR/AcrR family transcriptional regulator [Candidatus Planktophila sp.]
MNGAIEPSRQEKRKSRTRTALIEAASAIVLAEGVNVPIQSITEKADVGFGSFYNHFASKEELFTAVAHEALDTWESETSHLLGKVKDPLEGLATTLRLYVRMNKTHPEIAKILNRTAPEMTEYPFEYSSQFQKALETLGREKVIDISSVPLNVLAIRSTLKQVLAIREKSPKFSDREADQVVEMMLIMMRISPSTIKRVMDLPLPIFSKKRA